MTPAYFLTEVSRHGHLPTKRLGEYGFSGAFVLQGLKGCTAFTLPLSMHSRYDQETICKFLQSG